MRQYRSAARKLTERAPPAKRRNALGGWASIRISRFWPESIQRLRGPKIAQHGILAQPLGLLRPTHQDPALPAKPHEQPATDKYQPGAARSDNRPRDGGRRIANTIANLQTK